MQNLWHRLSLIPALLTIGASPIDETWSQEKRLGFLKDFFDPQPGTSVKVETVPVLGDKTKSIAPSEFKGWIQVNPKAGVCLTIKRRDDLPDQIVCQSARLSFRAQDLDRDGRLNWEVSTHDKDFGTILTWQTPYRYIRVVDESMPWPGPSRVMILKSCQAFISKELGKRLVVNFLDGTEWRIAFPDEDLFAPQPTKSKPNLFVQESVFSSGFIKVESKEEIAARRALKSKQSGDKFAKSSEPIDESDPNKIKTPWQMYPRGSFQMEGSNFKGSSSPPAMMNSVCRYKYKSSAVGNEGELECHNVTDYKWLYARLPCLKDLKKD